MKFANPVHKSVPDPRVRAFSNCPTTRRQFRSWQIALRAQFSLEPQASRTNRSEGLPACTLAKVTVVAPQTGCYVRIPHDRKRRKYNRSWRI